MAEMGGNAPGWETMPNPEGENNWGVNHLLGSPMSAGGPVPSPQPSLAPPSHSGGRKCHTKCHHSGENKPNEMKRFMWGWGGRWGETIPAGVRAQLHVRGSRISAHERVPRLGSAPCRAVETPWVGTRLDPRPGPPRMAMKRLPRGWHCRAGASGDMAGLAGPRLSPLPAPWG